jgi:hypothetical protein
MNKIDINDRYPSDGEIRVDKKQAIQDLAGSVTSSN